MEMDRDYIQANFVLNHLFNGLRDSTGPVLCVLLWARGRTEHNKQTKIRKINSYKKNYSELIEVLLGVCQNVV